MTWGEWLVRAYCRGAHYRGKIRVARWLAKRFLPAEGGVYTLADGTRLLLHPRDWIEYRLLQRETYEPVTLAFLRANLKEGHQAVLAGVNIGLHVLISASMVKPTGKVVGVEPQPSSLLRARQNILLNDGLAAHVFLVSAALGAEAGLAGMVPAPEHNSGMASLVDQRDEPLPFSIVVETLPELLYRLKLRRPDLMLLDVEGFELPVLRGITPSTRPKIMIVESKSDHQTKGGASERELFDQLTSMGYDLFDLRGQPAVAGQELVEFNLIAVARDAPPIVWVKSSDR
ncbi:FkbM family methyltransferase [bacterium]|nr:FkbM family methyltransferase [bacterium]